MRSGDALLVIDVQNDFCPGGKLPVAEGDAVVPVICQLAARFEHILLTQDWHPPGHASFASCYPGRQPFEAIQLPYGSQTLWPDHCVQGTPGAEFHPGLAEVVARAELILRKGFRREIDSYSAFLENDKETPTGLTGYIHERGIDRLFVAGLAYDYCVRFSALDAVRAGFEAWVVADACRSVGPSPSTQATRREFERDGVNEIDSARLLNGAIIDGRIQ